MDRVNWSIVNKQKLDYLYTNQGCHIFVIQFAVQRVHDVHFWRTKRTKCTPSTKKSSLSGQENKCHFSNSFQPIIYKKRF